MSQGVSVRGVSVQGVSDRGVHVLGVSVRGVHVRGGSVLSPYRLGQEDGNIQYALRCLIQESGLIL